MLFLTLFFSLLFLAGLSSPAQAYIDPGTGSMVFQALVAGVLGFFFTVKMYWHVLKEKFRRFFSKKTDVNTDDKNPKN